MSAWRDIQDDLAAAGADHWPDTPEVVDLLARLARARPPWQADGACHEHPDLDWFATRAADQAAAKAVCAECLVRAECLDYALEHREHGIWGGTDDEERRVLRRAG